MRETQRIAVVGSGIAGLATAWLLARQHDVTLFEADSRPGGHTNTVDVSLDGHSYPVDTGFLVFNERTYPELIGLFDHLGIDSVATEMSFSVSLQQPDLEWAGSNLATLFGQKRNLLRPAFWQMLTAILRFNRESRAWLARGDNQPCSLGEFLAAGRYPDCLADWYLLPMAAAIWSCPTGQMREMPLATFVRFCDNHGLLQIFNRPTWRTVRGGGREYVQRMLQDLDDVRLSCPVQALQILDDGLNLQHAGGTEHFDQVVLACHSDQSLQLLGSAGAPAHCRLLAGVRYQHNRAVLHTDTRLLPRHPSLWSAWNYMAGDGDPGLQPVGVSYLLNQLQPLPFSTPVIVTLNPVVEPAAEQVIASFDYAHPLLDAAAIEAQGRLAQVQGQQGIWLAGAWTGYGFHEDGLRSALRIAEAFGVSVPWHRQPVAARA